MSLLSPTREANIRKLERRLRTAKYNKKDLTDAMKLANDQMNNESTTNMLDMSGQNAKKFKDIHNTLVLHSTLNSAKNKKNNKDNIAYVDPNITANILSYMGGRSARRTRKRRTRKSVRGTTTKSKRKYKNRTRRSRTKTRRRR